MPEETLCTVQIAAQLHFNNVITLRIGRKSVPGDFPVEDLTLKYEHYHGQTIEDGQDNAYKEGSSDDDNLDPLPTPEAGDNYISAEVLLPLGGVLRQGKVISCKRDADGNTIGQAYEWPILDTWTYGVEFDDGTITDLMAIEFSNACMHNVTREVISTYCLIALVTLINRRPLFPLQTRLLS
jgi:hypothetical protein